MSIFKGGHYCIIDTRLGCLAAHTFVGVEDKPDHTVWFDCYGGHSDNKKRKYPAVKVGGDLDLARVICCFDPKEFAKYMIRKPEAL